MDFVVDGLATGRIASILSVVDAYTRECVTLEADFSLGSGRVTRVLEQAIAERGRPENLRSDNGPEFTSRRMLGWAEDWKVGLVHIQPGKTDAERARRKLPRKVARRVPQRELVPHSQRCTKHPGKLAARVQLRASAQLAQLGVPAEGRLCRTASTTKAARSFQSKTKTGKLVSSVDEKKGAGHAKRLPGTPTN